jgi:hypothetical protein
LFDSLQNPSFFDHFKRRSENTKHIFGNNKDLTMVRVANFSWPKGVSAMDFSKNLD